MLLRTIYGCYTIARSMNFISLGDNESSKIITISVIYQCSQIFSHKVNYIREMLHNIIYYPFYIYRSNVNNKLYIIVFYLFIFRLSFLYFNLMFFSFTDKINFS